jgi:hypothetical protein
MQLSRRQIVAGLAAGGLVGTAALGGVALLWRPGVEHAATADLLSLLPDPRAAAKIGAAWLGRHSQFAESWDALPNLVSSRLAQSGWQGGSREDLRRQVAVITRQDFDAGAIEDVDGWRLSQFQAQLCGLACLDASRPKLS